MLRSIGLPSRTPMRLGTSRRPTVVTWRASVMGHEAQKRTPKKATPLKNTVLFPGEDAPGTGRRLFPSTEEFEEAPSEVITNETDKHRLRTTQEYYAVFPSLVHTSCPLEITDTVPSGYTIQGVADAGPKSGKRKPPEVYDTDPPALDPDHEETVETRLRELKLRRSC